MSEASGLNQLRSEGNVEHHGTPRRSRSVPSAVKIDPSELYTSQPDGIPPLLILFLQIARDVVTFFIRGGLGTMMFSMDMILRIFIFVFDTWLQLPGVFILTNLARMILWFYQLAMWIAYTLLELTLYLPTPMLILYLMALSVAYYVMPEEVLIVLHSMLWTGKQFFKIFKYFAFETSKDFDDDDD